MLANIEDNYKKAVAYFGFEDSFNFKVINNIKEWVDSVEVDGEILERFNNHFSNLQEYKTENKIRANKKLFAEEVDKISG